ncbi:MAG: HD domain-containing protein [Gemmatimonadota bacterium]|nr:HD domain-containing protein [Gemmatimonadota bacterium]
MNSRDRRTLYRGSALLGLGSAGVGAAVYLTLRHLREGRLSQRIAAASLETLLRAVDANDHDTGLHVRRVASYALILARAAELDTRHQRSVERVALFHDIGKIAGALYDIVHDDTQLSKGERELIDTHPWRGCEVLRPLAIFYPDLCDGVLSHHERWDGSGYPRQLKGGAIPLSARIVSIADTFDVVTHGRRYEAKRTLQEGADVIAAGRGQQFDPDLTDLFLLPPVFSEISRAMRRRAPEPEQGRRSARRAKEGEVPDITFRWRTQKFEPQPPDRARPSPP